MHVLLLSGVAIAILVALERHRNRRRDTRILDALDKADARGDLGKVIWNHDAKRGR